MARVPKRMLDPIGGSRRRAWIPTALGTVPRDLIQAEEIVLVVAGSRDAAPDDTVPPVGEVGPRTGPGERVLDDRSCCILVDRLREVAQGQSLVQTGMKRRREFSMLPKVDSCIIVPVVRRQSLLGWLLAVNRTPAKPPRQAPPDNAPLRSPDDDFGTFEANLLDFAGVILAAHPCSADLFGQEATARLESPVAS